MIKIGDYVTRKSYGNDVVFKLIDINEKKCVLKGLNIRLIADASFDDLELASEEMRVFDDTFLKKNEEDLHRNDYFYVPGKVLHIDGDSEYLKRCLKYYKELEIPVVGKTVKEEDGYKVIKKLLEENSPDIVVITGHDAYYKKRIGSTDLYKNSKNFIKTVKEARKYEKSNENLIIIAGACQSDYENIIKSGANFASSPKRINIHALDPAIVASSISKSIRDKNINLIGILNKTKYGIEGLGGIQTKGTMYIGYPRINK